jgi:copper homeostasis protein
MLLEICVENFDSALTAENCGADRIELCADLFLGGLTPGFDLLKSVKEKIKIPVHVMIRPRAGDFFYSDSEFDQMKKEIGMAKQFKADGVVFGLLTADKKIDVSRTKKLVEFSKPLKVTFHRAFDETAEPYETLENIIDCGVDILLTSGQKEKAIDGAELIRELNVRAKGKIEIMAGSGITDKNILEIAEKAGVKSFHGSAKRIGSDHKIAYADEKIIKGMKSHLCKLA